MSVDCTDGEPFDVYPNNRIQRARVEHKCGACREPIRRGDMYSYTFAVFDGSPEAIKRCARCELLYRALVPIQPEDTACDPELNCGHTWEENFGDPPPEHVARLAFVTPDEAQTLFAEREHT
jgi:hypothetical protein